MAGSFNSTKQVYQDSYYVEVRTGIVPFFELFKADAGGNVTLLAFTSDDVGVGVSHDIRVTRTEAGLMNVYLDGVLKLTYTDNSITASTNVAIAAMGGGKAIAGVNYYTGTVDFDDILYSLSQSPTGAVSKAQATLVSAAIDQGATINSEGIFQATYVVPTGTSVSFYTATSADNVTYDAYVAATLDAQIGSTARRYIKWKAVLNCPMDDGLHNTSLLTPLVSDVTVTWTIGTGTSTKYPSSVSFFFTETLNIDLEQVYADTVAGGSAIVNYASVKAQPKILNGSNTDVQWQGTVQTPPVEVSVGNPLSVTNGQTLTYPIVVSSGMDTSRMSGANPAAAVVTFAGGGAGSWVFSSIHPTRPVLVITITGTGTITALQVQGKGFSNDDTLLEKTSYDASSIQQFDERRLQISNENIVNTLIAQAIADRLILNLADPTIYIPQVKVRPTFSIQLGDRVEVTDTNLAVEEDSLVIGVDHTFSANMTGGEVFTTLKLLKIPEGS